MVNYLPKEVLPGDLLAGARFNIQTSACLTEKETRQHDKLIYGPKGARAAMLWFHNHGYGNAGATSGHLIPDYGRIVREGWKEVHAELEDLYASLPENEKKGPKGGQLRAMLTAATMPRDLAYAYAQQCQRLAEAEADPLRKQELAQMADNLAHVPWEPARTFWEAVQSLWLTHMLVMADENYPGPGVSFGRIDQYLFPLWEKSVDEGDGPGVRQGDPQVLLDPLQHRLRRHDPHRRQPGHHRRLRPAAHPLRHGRGRRGPDQRPDLRHPGRDRRDVAHPGAQAQRAPAPRLARRCCSTRWSR